MRSEKSGKDVSAERTGELTGSAPVTVGGGSNRRLNRFFDGAL
jgi:hypothetical protein